MRDYLKRPSIMEEARSTGRSHNWFIELLIYVGVFIVASIFMGIISTIGMVAYLFTSPAFLNMIKNISKQGYDLTANIQLNSEILNDLMRSDRFTVLMLFSEILIIGVVLFYCRQIERRKINTLGFVKKDFFGQYLKGLGIGLVMFSFAVVLCLVTGSVRITGISVNFSFILLVLYFLGYMIQGMAEEVMCRGYLMVSLSRRYSVPVSILISSLVFAALHLGNSGVTFFSFFNLVLFAVFAALVFIKQGNIWIVAGIHSMWNFTQGNLFGIQVSGLDKQNSILNSNLVEGKAWMNGGSFGLEGGMAVMFILLAGIGLTLYLFRKEGKLQGEDQLLQAAAGQEADILPSETAERKGDF